MVGQSFLACSLPLSALWASAESEKMSHAEVKPSFGKYSTASSVGHTASKKSFFSVFSGKGTNSSAHSEVEKGSFMEESDHVLVQKTLQVTSTESPAPVSTAKGTYGF
jgi:hypothetical protein